MDGNCFHNSKPCLQLRTAGNRIPILCHELASSNQHFFVQPSPVCKLGCGFHLASSRCFSSGGSCTFSSLSHARCAIRFLWYLYSLCWCGKVKVVGVPGSLSARLPSLRLPNTLNQSLHGHSPFVVPPIYRERHICSFPVNDSDTMVARWITIGVLLPRTGNHIIHLQQS